MEDCNCSSYHVYFVCAVGTIRNIKSACAIEACRSAYGIWNAVYSWCAYVFSLHCDVWRNTAFTMHCSRGRNAQKHAAVRASLAYNLGRILGYTFVGAVLGGLSSVIGHTVNQNTLWQGVFKAVVGICMIVSAGNLIGIFPALRRLRIPLPRGIYRLFAKGNRAPFSWVW